ncbi:MAG: hypothetical protein NVS1B4_14300 [Gemmatimonadaceae bacterium]
MKRTMTHDEAAPELGAEALGALTADESAAVLAHVAECARCTAELESLRSHVAGLALAAPPVALPAPVSTAVRSRLLARAGADVGRSLRSPSTPSTATGRSIGAPVGGSRWSGAAPWLALAASLLFVVSLGVIESGRRSAETLRRALAAQSAIAARAVARVDTLERAVADRNRTLAALTGPGVRVMELTATGRKDPVARMFWDRATNTWTMYAHNLAKPGAGKTYQLWLVTTSGQKISAGTFDPSPAGDVNMSAVYALGPTALKAVAITVEPEGGVAQPTGPIVILGAAGA